MPSAGTFSLPSKANADAQWELGLMQGTAAGVLKDSALAHMWFQQQHRRCARRPLGLSRDVLRETWNFARIKERTSQTAVTEAVSQ